MLKFSICYRVKPNLRLCNNSHSPHFAQVVLFVAVVYERFPVAP